MTIALPTILREQMHAAHAVMRSHPKHALAPIFRKNIYDAMASLGRPSARAWLAFTAANYVQPVWEAGQVIDALVAEVLLAAHSLLKETRRRSEPEVLAANAWLKLEELGLETNDPKEIRALFAGEAAVSALQAVLGRDPFDLAQITEQDTDADLDPWSSDTALWACAAYAGRLEDPASDSLRRLAFWSWWLNEAIVSSWHASASAQE